MEKVLIVGIFQVISYVMVLFAMKLSQISYIVPARELNVVFGILLGINIFKGGAK